MIGRKISDFVLAMSKYIAYGISVGFVSGIAKELQTEGANVLLLLAVLVSCLIIRKAAINRNRSGNWGWLGIFPLFGGVIFFMSKEKAPEPVQSENL